jgi:hypothetical protein
VITKPEASPGQCGCNYDQKATRFHSSVSKSLAQVFSVDGAPMNSQELKS